MSLPNSLGYPVSQDTGPIEATCANREHGDGHGVRFPVSQDTGPIEASEKRTLKFFPVSTIRVSYSFRCHKTPAPLKLTLDIFGTLHPLAFRCHKTPAPLKQGLAIAGTARPCCFPVSQDTGPIEAMDARQVRCHLGAFRCLKTPAPLKPSIVGGGANLAPMKRTSRAGRRRGCLLSGVTRHRPN